VIEMYSPTKRKIKKWAIIAGVLLIIVGGVFSPIFINAGRSFFEDKAATANSPSDARMFISHASAKKGFLKAGNLKMILVMKAGSGTPDKSLNYWLAIRQGETVDYQPLEDFKFYPEEGTVVFDIDYNVKGMENSEPFYIGLKAGYGELSENRVFSLVNRNLEVYDGATYFAEYNSYLSMWVIK